MRIPFLKYFQKPKEKAVLKEPPLVYGGQEFLVPVRWETVRIVSVRACTLSNAIENTLATFNPEDVPVNQGTVTIDPEEARLLNEEF